MNARDWFIDRAAIDVDVWQLNTADATLHPSDSSTERIWLPKLGPTAMLAARRIAQSIAVDVHRFDLEDLAAALGVGRPALVNALARLVRFRLASIDGDRFALRAAWPMPGGRP